MNKLYVAGIIILAAVSPLFRGLFFDYEAYAFLGALALFSVLYFLSKMIKGEPVRINRWSMLSGALLIAAAAASFIEAANPRENLEGILRYAGLFAVFLILYDYFCERKQQLIFAVMLSSVLAGSACSVAGLMALAGPSVIPGVTVSSGRVGATFQYANTASVYFILCLLFALSLANAAKSPLLRGLSAGAGNILIFALFMTGSRGGYIIGIGAVLLLLAIQPRGCRARGFIHSVCMLAPVFITMKGFGTGAAAQDSLAAAKWLAISFFLAAVLSLLASALTGIISRNKSASLPKWPGYLTAAAIAAVLILAFVFRDGLASLLPPVMSSRLERLFKFGVTDINVLYRLEYDKDALKLIAGNWLLGLGGGGWKALYQSVQDYFYTAAFVHNHYLQVFVESGIFGFAAYVALAAGGIFNAAYSYLKAADKVLKSYTAGLLCGLLALSLHSAFDFDLSFTSLSLLLWAMLAAAAAGLPTAPGAEGAGARLFMWKWEIPADHSPGKIIAIAACSFLFSMNAVYFAGAHNEHEALEHMQAKNYKAAAVYYEEAYRLDPENTAYAFELAKLYNYFAGKSPDAENKQIWLEKARIAGENSVRGNRFYPAHINTLVQTYLASDMPLQALEYAQRLVRYQRYNGFSYELLARSYLAASGYYGQRGDAENEKELLVKCIGIGRNPYLLRSNIDEPHYSPPQEAISSYEHSKELSAYLDKASVYLERLR